MTKCVWIKSMNTLVTSHPIAECIHCKSRNVSILFIEHYINISKHTHSHTIRYRHTRTRSEAPAASIGCERVSMHVAEFPKISIISIKLIQYNVQHLHTQRYYNWFSIDATASNCCVRLVYARLSIDCSWCIHREERRLFMLFFCVCICFRTELDKPA